MRLEKNSTKVCAARTGLLQIRVINLACGPDGVRPCSAVGADWNRWVTAGSGIPVAAVGSVVETPLDVIVGAGNFFHDHFCGALHFVSCFDGLILYTTQFLLYLLPLLLDFIPFFTTLGAGKMSLNSHSISVGY